MKEALNLISFHTNIVPFYIPFFIYLFQQLYFHTFFLQYMRKKHKRLVNFSNFIAFTLDYIHILTTPARRIRVAHNMF